MATSQCLLVVLLVHDGLGLAGVFERALVVAVEVFGDFCDPVPVGGPQQVHVGQGAAEHEEEEGAQEHGEHSHAECIRMKKHFWYTH